MASSTEASTALRRILTGEAGGRHGAILTGEAGDRRETIEAAIAALPPGRPPARLHGSAFAAATPYGALAMLLSGLEQNPPPSLHGMLRALAGFLHPEGEWPAVVILSQPDQIDAGAITVLSQLVQVGSIRLVIHCDRPTDVPEDFAALMRADVLEGIAVRPLTPAAGKDLIEEILDGPVSRFACTVLWRHSGGSVSRLRQLVRDCVETGKLSRTADCWIMVPGSLPRINAGGKPTTALRHLPARQRSLLEMLAVCGPMSVSDLIHVGYAHELDTLQAGGALEIRNDRSGRLAVLGPVQSAETLGAIEPDRRRELSAMLQSLDPGCHGLLRAADQLIMIGDVHGAVSLFEEAEWQSDEDLTPEGARTWAHLAWSEVRARAAAGDLAGAQAVVKGSPVADSASLSVLAACVAIAKGDIREAHAHLDVAPTEHLPELLSPRGTGFTGETVRCRALVLRAEALALGDDQDGALALLERLEEELAGFCAAGIIDDVLSPDDRALLAQSMLNVLLVCGQVERCRQLAETVLDSHHGYALSAQYAELILAAIDAITGKPEQAYQRAVPLVAQLEAVGNPHELQVARALVVGCSQDGGEGADNRDAELMLALVDGHSRQQTDQSLGRLGWLAELLLACSTGRMHSPEARSARLVALADRAAEAGLFVVEYTALGCAFQFGELRLAPRLAESAARTQTATSASTLLLARSVLEDDERLLIRALEGFAAVGHAAHYDKSQSPLVKDLSPQVLRRIADSAPSRQLAGTSVPDGGGSDPAWMAQLTRREREIARLVVEGKSNIVVARITGISVRTVEGHLYQIYGKLHVKNRTGLDRLASAQASLRQVR